MLTPDDVRNAAFSSPPLGKRGYNQEQVDEFLDLLESTLRGTGGQVTAAQVRAVTFGKPPIGKRGYNEDEVDQFLDRAAAHLDGGAVADPMRAEPRSNVAPPGMVAPKRRWWQR